MASINLDRKSRLKFGLSRDMQVSLYDPKLLKISMVTWWCWQCGIVLEPSVVAVCVTLITLEHDSPKIPSGPTYPCRHVHTGDQIPKPSSNFSFGNRMFLPKERLLDPSLIRATIPKFPTSEFCFFGLIWSHALEKTRCLDGWFLR